MWVVKKLTALLLICIIIPMYFGGCDKAEHNEQGDSLEIPTLSPFENNEEEDSSIAEEDLNTTFKSSDKKTNDENDKEDEADDDEKNGAQYEKVSFGKYSWRILDKQDDMMLIITEGVIEERPYNENNEEYGIITWENSSIRKYLNSEFLLKFSEEEQNQILLIQVDNPDNVWFETAGGNRTWDKVFLLSLEEADRYFGNGDDYLNIVKRPGFNSLLPSTNDADRVAAYGTWNWMLRSPGAQGWFVAYIGHGGLVSVAGDVASNRSRGIRPALWIEIQGLDE